MKLFRTYKFLDGQFENIIFKVYYSDSKKKYQVNIFGKIIYHGAKGYSISPGTNKGNSYCARSINLAVPSIYSANFWSRLNWNCEGNTSIKGNIIKTPLGKVKIL